MDPTPAGRDVAVADRLGRAFGVWRLRPGDLEQPAYAIACERLREAVPADGVSLGVHGPAFVAASGEHVDAGAAAALAEGLYRLGVERLHAHRAPTPTELDRFLAAVEEAADREDLHHRLGAVSQVLEPVSIAPTAAGAEAVEDREGWREVWDRLGDPGSLAGELATSSSGEPTELLDRIVAFRDLLPEEQQRSPELADRLHALVSELPAELRIAVARQLIDAPDAAFAGWLLSSVTDHDLGELLVGVDGDVAGLARRVLGRDLGDLGTDVALPAPATLAPPEPEDGRSPAAVSATPLSTESLELFLALERRPDRQRAALLHWQRRVQDALQAREFDTVHDLLGLLHRANATAEHDLTATIDGACAAALGDDELLALLPPAGEPLPEWTESLLRAFGPVAVDAVVGRLVTEEDRQRRSQFVSILATLVAGHTNALLRWVEDPRWFVVRNVVTALWRAADPAAVPLLERAAANPEPRVRHEAARALAAVGAIGTLGDLLSDADADVRTSARRLLAGLATRAAAERLAEVVRHGELSGTDRRALLDSLASHPHGPPLLRDLADGDALPLRLRWHAGRAATGGGS